MALELKSKLEAVTKQRDELLADLAEHLKVFDEQVASYRRMGDEAIARISEQCHGRRMERTRALIARVREAR